MKLQGRLLEPVFMRCLMLLELLLLSKTTGNTGDEHGQHKDTYSSTLQLLEVLEGDQTSLSCPIDVASRRAVSVIWYHFSVTDHNEHSPHSSQKSNVQRQAKKVYALEAPATSPNPVLAGSAGIVDGTHWKQPQWSTRAFFSLLSDPPALLLNRLELSDTGGYICNVTYRDDGDNVTSGVIVTEARAELFVAVPLPPPLIMDNKDTVLNRTAGPYAEGDTLVLKCMLPPSEHKLTLAWRWNGEWLSLSTAIVETSGGGLKSILEIGPLRREHFLSNISCIASSDASRPVESSVLLDMFLAPEDVTLKSWPHDSNDTSGWVMLPVSTSGATAQATASTLVSALAVDAGRTVALHNSSTASSAGIVDSSATWTNSFSTPRGFECEVIGSRPPANVTWLLDGRPLDDSLCHTHTEGNVTTSVLLLPASDHAGKELECRAVNGHLPQGRGVVSRYVAVEKPDKAEVRIKLGTGLNASHITEGADVYMECSGTATSGVTDVSWSYDGSELDVKPAEGIVVTSRYLVIRRVAARHRGNYTCIATSTDGTKAESLPLYLRVRYSPQCGRPEEKTIRVDKNAAVNVTCDVRADPMEGLRYFWLLWNDTQNITIPNDRSQAFRARQAVRPLVTDSDRMEIIVNASFFNAILSCWAANAVGTQRKRCRFTFARIKYDFPGLACSVGNNTDTSFSLTCWSPSVNDTRTKASWQEQRLRVDVFDTGRGNRSERSFWSRDMGPMFVTRLRPSTDYFVEVRMPPNSTYRTHVRTLGPAQTLKGQRELTQTTQRGSWTLTVSIVLVACCLAATLAVLVSVYCACAHRRWSRKPRRPPDEPIATVASRLDEKSDDERDRKLFFVSTELSRV